MTKPQSARDLLPDTIPEPVIVDALGLSSNAFIKQYRSGQAKMPIKHTQTLAALNGMTRTEVLTLLLEENLPEVASELRGAGMLA